MLKEYLTSLYLWQATCVNHFLIMLNFHYIAYLPPFKFEQQSVIKFLANEGVSVTKTYTRMCAVYDSNNVLSK